MRVTAKFHVLTHCIEVNLIFAPSFSSILSLIHHIYLLVTSYWTSSIEECTIESLCYNSPSQWMLQIFQVENINLNAFLFFSTEYKNLSTLKQCNYISCCNLSYSHFDLLSIYHMIVLFLHISVGCAVLNVGQFSMRILANDVCSCESDLDIVLVIKSKICENSQIEPSRIGFSLVEEF